MQQSDGDQSIYDAATSCSKLFIAYLEASTVSDSRHDIVKELLSRFNLWAAYVGAFAPPKASLDARLAGHDDVRDMFLELLVMVQRNIIQGKIRTLASVSGCVMKLEATLTST